MSKVITIDQEVGIEEFYVNRHQIQPTHQSYLFQRESLLALINTHIKEKTGVEVEVGIEINDGLIVLTFDEEWAEDLSIENYEKLKGLYEGFYPYRLRSNSLNKMIEVVFGFENARCFAINVVDKTFDVLITADGSHFIAIYCDGGIISETARYASLETAVYEMNKKLYHYGFRADCDDARIFDSNNEEVYSFPHELFYDCRKNEVSYDNYMKLAMKFWRGEIEDYHDISELIETLNK